MINPELKLYQSGRQQARELRRQDRLLGGIVDRTGAGAGGIDLSLFNFGYVIEGAVVTVNAGEIHHGDRSPVLVSAAEITITADHQYVWVAYTFGGTASVSGPSVSKPKTDSVTFRAWLALFRLVDDYASVERYGHIGNIEILGVFG